MANETNNDITGALGNLANAYTSLVKQSLEIITTGVKDTLKVIEPLGKSALDVLGSATNTLGQAVQNVTSAIAPKK
ncbi:MAG: chlorosome envelope protein B [Chlorobiaceae bacterium]